MGNLTQHPPPRHRFARRAGGGTLRRSSGPVEVPCCSCRKAFRTNQKQPSKLVTISGSIWNVTREKRQHVTNTSRMVRPLQVQICGHFSHAVAEAPPNAHTIITRSTFSQDLCGPLTGTLSLARLQRSHAQEHAVLDTHAACSAAANADAPLSPTWIMYRLNVSSVVLPGAVLQRRHEETAVHIARRKLSRTSTLCRTFFFVHLCTLFEVLLLQLSPMLPSRDVMPGHRSYPEQPLLTTFKAALYVGQT